MDVQRAAGVVSREDGCQNASRQQLYCLGRGEGVRRGQGRTGKLRDALCVRRPRPSQPRLLEICAGIRAAETAARAVYRWLLVDEVGMGGGVAGVVSCGVGVPDVDEHVGEGLACRDVYHADVEKLLQG